jgi:hypothetical protein
MSRDDTTIPGAAESGLRAWRHDFLAAAMRWRAHRLARPRLRLDWIGASFTLAAVRSPLISLMPMPLPDIRIGPVLACA